MTDDLLEIDDLQGVSANGATNWCRVCTILVDPEHIEPVALAEPGVPDVDGSACSRRVSVAPLAARPGSVVWLP
jgi:hypothetical protein